MKLRLILLLVEMTNHVKGRYSDAVVIGCECAGSLRTSAWRCISERDYAVEGHGASWNGLSGMRSTRVCWVRHQMPFDVHRDEAQDLSRLDKESEEADAALQEFYQLLASHLSSIRSEP